MDALLSRLPLLVAARYPLVWLLSSEEERVERGIERVAGAHGFEVWRWRSSTGLVYVASGGGVAEGGGPPSAPTPRDVPGTHDPDAALVAVSKVKVPAFFVFEDLDTALHDPGLVRRLRDVLRDVAERRQAVVVLSNRLVLPSALEKDAIVLDVPLPSREEVGRLLAVLLLSQRIEVPAERFEAFVTACLGLTEKEIKRAFARILLDGQRFGDSDVQLLLDEKEALLRRSRFLEFVRSDVKIDGVGGLDALKEWLRQRSSAFGTRARAYGLPEPKGLFLLGVQGCGKSLAAKAVADLWRLPLLRLDVGSLFQGQADEGLRDTIRIAESLAPAVLWIDEIEKAFLGDGAETGRVFGAFLTWMQEKKKPVFVVGTANDVRSLPPELLRKGRFDEIFFVDLPNVHERLEILDIHVRRVGRNPEDWDLLAVAEETEKYSGAELEQLVVAALFRSFAADRELTQDDLLKVARETIPLAVTMDDRLKELREWARPRARLASVDTRRMRWFDSLEGEDV